MSDTTAPNNTPISEKAKAWQEELAKTADIGGLHGMLFGWIGMPILTGIALGTVAGLAGLEVIIGLGSILLGFTRGALNEKNKNFYKWEEDKIKNISYKNNKAQAYLKGFMLFAPMWSPLLWPISLIVKSSVKSFENGSNLKQDAARIITAPIRGISDIGKTIFSNPVLAEEKQSAAAAKAAAEPMQIAALDTAAPAIAVAAPIIETAANAPIRPARSTIGNNRVTVRLPGATPGEGA